MWYVYFARLTTGRLYVGISHVSVTGLLTHHQQGRHCTYTTQQPVTEIVWKESKTSYQEARKRERQLKGWTRAKKEALIRGDLQLLKQLARKKRNQQTRTSQ